MHGMLLESANHYGQVEYGETVWQKVMATVGCKNTVFNTYKTYPDCLVPQLAEACAEILESGDAADYMMFFGRCFVRFCCSYEEYEKILKTCARHFCQFLQEVDNVHSRIRFSYHKMKSPSMLVTAYDMEGAVLQYRSVRKGFKHYLIGQLLQIAHDFYDLPLEVSVMDEGMDESINIVNLRLDFDNSAFLAAMQRKNLDFKRIPMPSINLGKLLEFFPFGLVMDKQLILRLAGAKLIQLMGSGILDKPFRDNFKVRRPNIKVSWRVIEIYGKVAWEVDALVKKKSNTTNQDAGASSSSSADNSLAPTECRKKGLEGITRCLLGGRRRSHRSEWVDQQRKTPKHNDPTGLLLKGQMLILKDLDLALFFSMPLLSDIDDLAEIGLFINDLSMHDLSREMVLHGWEHGSSLEITYDRAEADANKLEESVQLYEQWKHRGDDLLYSMLPRQVAEHLRQGKSAIDTCKAFDQVSVLFAETTQLDGQSNSHALDIVRSVNSCFSLLDKITEKYQVFKVETVGVVYMVVSGAPELRSDHAAQVAALAIDMVEAFDQEIPRTHTIRIGIHVGPVVAGVVGHRLPRYCLFGDTVNTASRMLTNGQDGKIHISEKCAKAVEKFGFATTLRGKLKIKGKGEMNTYWLEDTAALTSATSEPEEETEDKEITKTPCKESEIDTLTK